MDGLACLEPSVSAAASQGRFTMDCQYRAALEISRRGELEITVPSDVAAVKAGEEPLPELPTKCRSDVLHRFKKLKHVFGILTESSAQQGKSC